MIDLCCLEKEDIDRYGRQIIMKDFGVQTQYKLQNKSVSIIGCNNTTKSAAIYLSASGIKSIFLFKSSESLNIKTNLENLNSNVNVEIFDDLNQANKSDIIVLNDEIDYKFSQIVLKTKVNGDICSLKVLKSNEHCINMKDLNFVENKSIEDYIGILQANEVIKYLGNIGKILNDSILYDFYENKPIKRSVEIVQNKLSIAFKNSPRKSSVLIIGCGGLGCPAGHTIANSKLFTTIGLVDNDVVEVCNLHRQVYHNEKRVGMNKAESLADHIKQLDPEVNVEVHKLRLSENNALDIIKSYDIIVDCTDNLPTTYLVNDCCVLTNKPLVKGNALEMTGHLTVYCYQGSPCYRCIYPCPPTVVGNCSENGVLGTVPGIMGTMQAIEAIKIVTKTGESLAGKFVLFSALKAETRVIKLRMKKSSCEACGDTPSITEKLMNYRQFCSLPDHDGCVSLNILYEHERINCVRYNEIIQSKEPHILLDVRPKEQVDICKFTDAINIFYGDLDLGKGLNELKEAIKKLKEENTDLDLVNVFVVCRRGNDSQLAVRLLQNVIPYKYVVFKDIIGGMTSVFSKYFQNDPIY